MEAIRENFPQSRIVALAPERCSEILRHLPFLDEVKTFDERAGERSLAAKARFIAWLRRERFEKVFLFHRSFTRALLAWLGGVGERIGYRTSKRARILTTAVNPPRKPLHQADYFLVLLKWAGLKVRFGAEYRFFYSSEDEKEAQRILRTCNLQEKSFVAFHVGANWEPKRWPVAHFSRLATLIQEAFSCPIVLTGSSADENLAQNILPSDKNGQLISLCGKTSLGALGALFRSAAFVVSSDSGPLHIASGVGTPVVALFGPTCPKLTGPRGTGKKIVLQFVPEGYSIPWKGKDLPPGGWMERISPEEVMGRIQQEGLWTKKKEKASSLSL